MDTKILPFLNLNGTSKKSLVEARVEFCNKLQEAIIALQNCSPHGRDTSSRIPDHFTFLLAEHHRRVKILSDLFNTVSDEAIAIDEMTGGR